MYSSSSDFIFIDDQCGTYKKEEDCYNREHSFPKSWFNDDYPMYTDLFHLYPTDGYVNNQRGNYPFGETNGEKYKSNGGFSKLGKKAPSAATAASCSNRLMNTKETSHAPISIWSPVTKTE